MGSTLRLSAVESVMSRSLNPVRLAFEALSRLRARMEPPGSSNLKAVNVAFVDVLRAKLPHDQAMELAIGGQFERGGAIEVGILRHYGLKASDHLVDVGCGAGRLAKPLSAYLSGTYLGIDLVPALVRHARTITKRPDWRFEVIDHIGIPEADGRADMVCFFSVLTHLMHEQSYWYLEEARRVLKPGGRVVFSFLEFSDPGHRLVFRQTVDVHKRKVRAPMNTFIERSAITAWASDLEMEIVEIRNGGDVIAPEGELGQSVCVLQKPL